MQDPATTNPPQCLHNMMHKPHLTMLQLQLLHHHTGLPCTSPTILPPQHSVQALPCPATPGTWPHFHLNASFHHPLAHPAKAPWCHQPAATQPQHSRQAPHCNPVPATIATTTITTLTLPPPLLIPPNVLAINYIYLFN